VKEPDFDKLADIAKRVEAASKKPGYSAEVFKRFAAEARAACGDYPQYTEFLGPFLPKSKDSRPASKNVFVQ